MRMLMLASIWLPLEMLVIYGKGNNITTPLFDLSPGNQIGFVSMVCYFCLACLSLLIIIVILRLSQLVYYLLRRRHITFKRHNVCFYHIESVTYAKGRSNVIPGIRAPPPVMIWI